MENIKKSLEVLDKVRNYKENIDKFAYDKFKERLSGIEDSYKYYRYDGYEVISKNELKIKYIDQFHYSAGYNKIGVLGIPKFFIVEI